MVYWCTIVTMHCWPDFTSPHRYNRALALTIQPHPLPLTTNALYIWDGTAGEGLALLHVPIPRWYIYEKQARTICNSPVRRTCNTHLIIKNTEYFASLVALYHRRIAHHRQSWAGFIARYSGMTQNVQLCYCNYTMRSLFLRGRRCIVTTYFEKKYIEKTFNCHSWIVGNWHWSGLCKTRVTFTFETFTGTVS